MSQTKNPGGYCHIPASMFQLKQEKDTKELSKELSKELRDRIGNLAYEVTFLD